MTEETELAPSGAQPRLIERASRMTDHGDHTQLNQRTLNHLQRNSTSMSGTENHMCGAATTTCVISGVGISVFIILIVIAILIHKRWKSKGSVNLKYLGNLSCLKPQDTKETVEMKCIGHTGPDIIHTTINCCVTTNRHSQPNAYMVTKLTDIDHPAGDVSKRKSNECGTPQEYCYIDIGQMENRERLSSMSPSTIYEDIDCSQYISSPVDHGNRFFQRATMFDNKDVIEVMENDIYDRCEEEQDCGVKIVIENDIYDSYNNADCYGTSVPEGHVYEEIGVGTGGTLNMTKN